MDTATPSKGQPDFVEAEDLDFIYHRMDVCNYEIRARKHALIIASRMLQLFRGTRIETLAKRMRAGLKPGGFIHISTIAVENLQYFKEWDETERIEENTYHSAKYDGCFHFFTRDELVNLFSGLKVRYYIERMTFDRRPSISRPTGVIQYVGHRERWFFVRG